MEVAQIDSAVHGDAHRRHARVVLMVWFVVRVVMLVAVMIVLGTDLHEFLRGLEGSDAEDFRQVDLGVA
ncbi:hypothetical protein D3C87_1669880 [compost metagenome]